MAWREDLDVVDGLDAGVNIMVMDVAVYDLMVNILLDWFDGFMRDSCEFRLVTLSIFER